MKIEAEPFAGDAAQRQTLRRNKLRAGLLLLGAAAIFLAVELFGGTGFWIGLLRAGSEAAVVGALADWFAVTAIFRRPLGLPIPHTAIVPRHKDRIGEGLGGFVAQNFLTPPLLAAKLRVLDPADRAARFLARPGEAERLAERLMTALPYLLGAMADQEIRDFAVRALGEQLREADLSAALGRVLSLVTAGAPFDTLFDRALDALHGALERETGTIYAVVEERTAWWVPKAIDRRIAGAVVAGLDELIAELRDKDSERRREFRERLAKLADDLVNAPEHRARIAALRDQLLDHDAVKSWLAAVWDGLRRVTLDDIRAPRSRTREAVARALHSLGRALIEDAAMRGRLNAAIEEAALTAIVPWRNEIGRFISDVVRGWETRTVVDRLELALGPDLQYIRITGTLVGACVGCALYFVSALLGR